MRGHPRVALDWSFVTPMMGLRVAAGFVLGALFAGCRGPLVPPSQSACGDPCAAMVCPGGSHCSWNTSCQPRCEVPPLSPNGR